MSGFVLKRCHGCNQNHFPLPKFCRWWEKRRTARKARLQGTEQFNGETINLVKNCINFLEEKLNGSTVYSQNELVNDFFRRSDDSCKPDGFHDLFDQKLRGGGNKSWN